MKRSLKILIVAMLIFAIQGVMVFGTDANDDTDAVDAQYYDEAYTLNAEDEYYDVDLPLEIQPRIPADEIDYDYDYEPIYWDMGENPDGENIMPIMADLCEDFEDLGECIPAEDIEAIRGNLSAENNNRFLFGLIAIIALALAVAGIRVVRKSKKFEKIAEGEQ
jgi:hypothetical protein